MKAFSVIVSRHALRFVGVAACVLPVSFAAATIGPKSTFQSFFQQTSSTITFDGSTFNFGCANNTNCYVIFSKVPAGNNLVINQVSCYVNVGWPDTAGDLVRVQLYPSRNMTVQRTQELTTVKTSMNDFAVNGTTMQIFHAGDTPQILLHTNFAAQFSEVSCTISGLIYTPT